MTRIALKALGAVVAFVWSMFLAAAGGLPR